MDRILGSKLLVVVLLLLTSTASAQDNNYKTKYTSSAAPYTFNSVFGFNIRVPSTWAVMSQRNLENVINSAGRYPNSKTLNEMVNNTREIIMKGQMEILWNTSTSNEISTDHIDIYTRPISIQFTKEYVNEYCKGIKQLLSETFGYEAKIHTCESIPESKAIYVESSPSSGTRMINMSIQRKPNELLVWSLSCKEEYINVLKQDFFNIINSIVYIKHNK